MAELAQRILKYPKFVQEEYDELIYTDSNYSVFHNHRLGLLFLVRIRGGICKYRIADKQTNALDITPLNDKAIVRWIAKWEDNARKQIRRLRQRIEDLEAERLEIQQTLGDWVE